VYVSSDTDLWQKGSLCGHIGVRSLGAEKADWKNYFIIMFISILIMIIMTLSHKGVLNIVVCYLGRTPL